MITPKNKYEEKINFDETNILTSSEDDYNRKELLWEQREENILIGWRNDCKIRCDQQKLCGKRERMKYVFFGIPTMVVPIILGGISPIIPCNSLGYSLGMMSSGIISGISIFFNFGKKTQEHFEFSSRFFELMTDIDSELCKPKQHRMACDVYIEKIKQRYNTLVSNSPDV